MYNKYENKAVKPRGNKCIIKHPDFPEYPLGILHYATIKEPKKGETDVEYNCAKHICVRFQMENSAT